jgi:hypothetical protein
MTHVAIKGHARAVAHLRGEADIQRALDNVIAIETLGRLIKQSVEARTTIDGRVDYRDVAADVLAVVAANQKGGR